MSAVSQDRMNDIKRCMFGVDLEDKRKELAAIMHREKRELAGYSRDRDIAAWAVAIDRHRENYLYQAKVNARMDRRKFVKSEFDKWFAAMLAQLARDNRILAAALYGKAEACRMWKEQMTAVGKKANLQLVYSRD